MKDQGTEVIDLSKVYNLRGLEGGCAFCRDELGLTYMTIGHLKKLIYHDGLPYRLVQKKVHFSRRDLIEYFSRPDEDRGSGATGQG